MPVTACYIAEDWQRRGMTPVFVVREVGSDYWLVSYLVDTWALGVKDIFLSCQSHEAFKGQIAGMHQRMVKTSYEEARNLVLGAVEFARTHQREPCKDWEQYKGLIEAERSFDQCYTFGRNGKFFHMLGPGDYAFI